MKDAYTGDGGRFERIDAKLTVFALANGVDLSKGDAYRRLEWFADGFERAILIEQSSEGSFGVALLKWKTRDPDPTPSPFRSDVAEADLVGLLDRAVEAANEL